MSTTETAYEALSQVEKNGQDLMSKAGKSVRKIADTVGDRFGVSNASELAHEVDARTKRAYTQIKGQVQQRPAVAVGIAAGAGLLIGLMLSSRR